VLTEVEKLMDKGEHRTSEEDAALELTVRLVTGYEQEHHPLPDPSPREMLSYLMGPRSLKQADLLPIFKSKGYVSDVVQGLGRPVHLAPVFVSTTSSGRPGNDSRCGTACKPAQSRQRRASAAEPRNLAPRSNFRRANPSIR